MVTLDADRFLNELGKLFKRTEKSGSVSVTMKRSAWCPAGPRKLPLIAMPVLRPVALPLQPI